MSDIFISYSSHDREKAKQLTELLVSAGLSVWIDQSGIEAATSWSKEIVDAIDLCKAFIVMLSPHSIASVNIVKEVSLAAEQKKKILPLDIEPVELPSELRYHLAGLQRTSMSNIDAVIRALGKLGIEATQAPSLQLVKETVGKKSLMILPFEDFSPTADNEWFTNGIVGELIQSLSTVKALRVMDAQTTKEFKSYKGHLTVYAKEMGIRYFVQGDVRKFGDNIKINTRLLDIESGDHLWQDTLKGTMEDIFDIQEQVAAKVVEGLKIYLTSDQKKKLVERGTENTEVYELYLKAVEYFARQTKEGFQLAIGLFSESIRLDPDYVNAYSYKANALTALYRTYERNPQLLEEAESLCREALRLKPDFLVVYQPLSQVYMYQGELSKAEETAKEYIRKAPEDSLSHFSLGFLYSNVGQHSKAIAPYEEAVRLESDRRAALFNLTVSYDATNETQKRMHWATAALPIEERHLKLHPDDETSRMQYAILLHFSGHTDEPLREARILKSARDGATLYNTACLFGMLDQKQEALATFRKAIEAGFKNLGVMKDFLVEEYEGIASLIGTLEYEEVKLLVEKLETEQNAEKTNV